MPRHDLHDLNYPPGYALLEDAGYGIGRVFDESLDILQATLGPIAAHAALFSNVDARRTLVLFESSQEPSELHFDITRAAMWDPQVLEVLGVNGKINSTDQDGMSMLKAAIEKLHEDDLVVVSDFELYTPKSHSTIERETKLSSPEDQLRKLRESLLARFITLGEDDMDTPSVCVTACVELPDGFTSAQSLVAAVKAGAADHSFIVEALQNFKVHTFTDRISLETAENIADKWGRFRFGRGCENILSYILAGLPRLEHNETTYGAPEPVSYTALQVALRKPRWKVEQEMREAQEL